jgi:hypothetical protein
MFGVLRIAGEFKVKQKTLLHAFQILSIVSHNFRKKAQRIEHEFIVVVSPDQDLNLTKNFKTALF